MANRIQLRRDTKINWNTVNPVLSDGEPGLEIDTRKIKYGDGTTPWQDLPYAGSSGSSLTDVDGVVTFPGDLLIGTLWPDAPMPEGDKESVIWAKDDTEYLGLWWGGSQTYPEPGYGPVAGIMIGPNDDSSLTDDFAMGGSPAGTKISLAVNGDMRTMEWIFDRDGTTSFPNYNFPVEHGTAGQVLVDDGDGNLSWGAGAGSGNTLTNDTKTVSLGSDGILTMPPGNETTSGWIQWSHASDDLTNVAGAGFVDYFNAYTGLGLTAPTNTNAEKGIWFGTPADPSSPFQPETSMVFRNDTLYLPKNGYIKSHDINRVGYANLTTVGTSVTIQTNDEYDWTFGADGTFTVPGEIKTTAGTGAVAVQSNDGSNNFTWNFTTHGAISLPELLSGAQGYGSLDANNNVIALTVNDTVDFHNFSGMILVNCHNSGNITLYLCGGGAGSTAILGSSKITDVGSLAFNAGIGGYTFTADETGDHVFFAIRTRTGG